MSAYDEGREAYMNGAYADDNPYEWGSKDGDFWADGWEDACWDVEISNEDEFFMDWDEEDEW